MKYYFVLLLLVTATALNAAALKPLIYKGGKHLTTRDTDTVIRKRSVSIGVNYGSDALFFGRTGPIKYPFMSTDFVYNAKSGFSFTVRQ